ncbi:multicopper oxidase [Ophiocordyceps camponoti-floridani]|uniref:Multicopper oxidase n=1 Tax=Ophiocordyceps camponoti-floridani TaxID=2030778 RepID=A0A8H4Q7A8_9HYPO|nr:multicopper oxidase [Ophiocordyceps camponoti-floridani]
MRVLEIALLVLVLPLAAATWTNKDGDAAWHPQRGKKGPWGKVKAARYPDKMWRPQMSSEGRVQDSGEAGRIEGDGCGWQEDLKGNSYGDEAWKRKKMNKKHLHHDSSENCNNHQENKNHNHSDNKKHEHSNQKNNPLNKNHNHGKDKGPKQHHPHKPTRRPSPPHPTACAGNTPSTRSKWCDLSIDTDYTTVAPNTGVTREYWLEITDVTVSPDGIPRSAMAVNGTMPGPTLFADWGDTVIVHVKNSLTTSLNGTSLHFHGIRQNFTMQSDGVPSITECPTPPGSVKTYHWEAVQYGSSWYHSHFGLQLWQGVFGGIVINGPATADYDVDLGVLFLNDWDARTVDELHSVAEVTGPPFLATGLINGTNVNGLTGLGQRLNISLEADKSYRLRLINAAIDTHFKLTLDNHPLKVIAADLVPITPYTTTALDIAIGQRYDLIITANQHPIAESFWLRALPQSSCSFTNNTDDIRAVVHYGRQPPDAPPQTTGYNFTDACVDETRLVPWVRKDVAAEQLTTSVFANLTTLRDGRFRWTLNSTSMVVDWGNPTALQLINGIPPSTFATSNAVIQLPEPDKLFSMVIESPSQSPTQSTSTATTSSSSPQEPATSPPQARPSTGPTLRAETQPRSRPRASWSSPSRRIIRERG